MHVFIFYTREICSNKYNIFFFTQDNTKQKSSILSIVAYFDPLFVQFYQNYKGGTLWIYLHCLLLLYFKL